MKNVHASNEPRHSVSRLASDLLSRFRRDDHQRSRKYKFLAGADAAIAFGTDSATIWLRDFYLDGEVWCRVVDLLDSGTDLTKRRTAMGRLRAVRELASRFDRERAAYKAFIRCLFEQPNPRYSARNDREVLDQMFGEFSRGNARTMEQLAERSRRPVAYLIDLRDRCLAALAAPAVASGSSRRAA